MRISVFGLGYVGCVSAACLAREGNDVIGVDINPIKVEMINSGESPIIEKELDDIIKDGVEKGRLIATTSTTEAIRQSDVSLICVGTPSNNNGSISLENVQNVSRAIGKALMNKSSYHVVVMRSTVLPGSVEGKIIPVLEESSGKQVRTDFGVCMNPEFLREGTAVFDFYNPSRTIIGERDGKSGDVVEAIYQKIDAPMVRTSIRIAEVIKYADNAFHALKVSFANEIGNLCKKLGIDSHKVMELFCMDTKLNLSPYYLKPGFAFGGSCLPKDLRALLHEAKVHDLQIPVLESVLRSNENQLLKGIEMVTGTGRKRIGILGFSFKAGTDDLRESPMVLLIENLLGKGYQLKIYDRSVSLAKLVGANKEYIEREIPHISALMCSSLDEVLSESEVLVIGNKAEEFVGIFEKLRGDQIVIDLVRISEDVNSIEGNYEGICW